MTQAEKIEPVMPNKNAASTLEKLMNAVPKFMHPELDRVQNLADLDFQIRHEIDLAEEGEVKWTKTQMHTAKMFYGRVLIAAQDFAREYPELVDTIKSRTARPQGRFALRPDGGAPDRGNWCERLMLS